MTIRVLIVDDSAVMRALITRKLLEDSAIEVVGTARDAMEARRMIKMLDPDVVTLDVEMPGMDGLSFLAKIMELRPTPVIIVSGSTGPGAEATARAMQLGAVNCYAKSTATRSIADDDGGLLAQMVREAAQINLGSARQSSPAIKSLPQSPAAPNATISRPDLIAVGSSTGGVEALHTLLRGFPEDCPPTLIVQHVNGCFASAIANSLDRDVKPRVSLAQPDTLLSRGQVYLAPGDEYHLIVRGRFNSGGTLRCAFTTDAPVSGHRPSVDTLFHSVALQVGAGALGILLTGMGKDGARGLLAMKQAGAQTIAQNEESSVVFGMPRAAIELGGAGHVLAIDQIAPRLFANGTPVSRATIAGKQRSPFHSVASHKGQ